VPPTPVSPSVTTDVNPASINVGESAVVSLILSNIPAEGYTGVEFTCTYNGSLVEASGMAATGLFGTDPAVALNGPQNGSFIFAIAGSDSHKATTDGIAFTFSLKGLQAGQTAVECKARVSTGTSTLSEILSNPGSLVIGTPATVTPTPVTATPTETTQPTASPTATATATSTPTTSSTLTGQVNASKPVTISLFDADLALVTSVAANTNGSFSLTAVPGTYTVVASAAGFLKAQGSVTLTDGQTSTMPTVSLLAGDIDGNNVIDQFDAMTIGMGYNTDTPAAADLNNDGVINVLDLELLAHNYRASGALAWQ
jgi:Carboxypeptidase regulatory-like domain